MKTRFAKDLRPSLTLFVVYISHFEEKSDKNGKKARLIN